MDTNEKILHRLNELIKAGDNILFMLRYHSSKVETQPSFFGSQSVQDLLQWAMSVQNLIVRIFGDKSVHAQLLKRLCSPEICLSDADKIQGILKSVKDDLEHDCLFELKSLIEAEIFDDFLEQAEYLIQAGYYQPAAVIIGCVLEDGLRKLCERAEVELPDRPKLDWMNAQLVKKNVYNKLIQKQITANAEIRNKAAHGKWNEFTKEDVIRFLDWTRDFMSRHFSQPNI